LEITNVYDQLIFVYLLFVFLFVDCVCSTRIAGSSMLFGSRSSWIIRSPLCCHWLPRISNYRSHSLSKTQVICLLFQISVNVLFMFF
jgi:hypothetical protein